MFTKYVKETSIQYLILIYTILTSSTPTHVSFAIVVYFNLHDKNHFYSYTHSTSNSVVYNQYSDAMCIHKSEYPSHRILMYAYVVTSSIHKDVGAGVIHPLYTSCVTSCVLAECDENQT